MTIALTLPYPPSVNRYWRNVRGIVVASREAKDYRMLARFRATQQGVGEPLMQPVTVTVHVYRPRKAGDLDNSLKALFDALIGIAYVDDKQVVEIHAYRHDDARNPRVEISITEVT